MYNCNWKKIWLCQLLLLLFYICFLSLTLMLNVLLLLLFNKPRAATHRSTENACSKARQTHENIQNTDAKLLAKSYTLEYSIRVKLFYMSDCSPWSADNKNLQFCTSVPRLLLTAYFRRIAAVGCRTGSWKDGHVLCMQLHVGSDMDAK